MALTMSVQATGAAAIVEALSLEAHLAGLV